jgi:hypothetical protein
MDEQKKAYDRQKEVDDRSSNEKDHMVKSLMIGMFSCFLGFAVAILNNF